ncbi:hypothetical protein VOLCADRAFT_107382 [Volvox carteri f. nagariensis]|uniref:PEP5/VPS11 N-terminal domain-containing protein n=1 Tax=Volvox carteri f. nagariensis TaxID=3068 RepID=D8UDN2_VOLCA|nr:uncharacterized protein VOLCADRAFT_107382 [Volvox carteri f. nagariensis]EFJ42126.1 hypothetical protein VOLCADRAFT_107382 [Volvox carteri f. nagariensis]|eukprot:XP_002956823.1 hypothetical protein VOLCADRAFT_107382 [Volvox carteri f. nagariensis]
MASPGNTMRTQSAKADHERYQLRQPTAAAAEPARVTGPTAALQPQRGTRQDGQVKDETSYIRVLVALSEGIFCMWLQLCRASEKMSFAFKRFNFFQPHQVPRHGFPPNASCVVPGGPLLWVGTESGSVCVLDSRLSLIGSFNAHGHKVLEVLWLEILHLSYRLAWGHGGSHPSFHLHLSDDRTGSVVRQRGGVGGGPPRAKLHHSRRLSARPDEGDMLSVTGLELTGTSDLLSLFVVTESLTLCFHLQANTKVQVRGVVGPGGGVGGGWTVLDRQGSPGPRCCCLRPGGSLLTVARSEGLYDYTADTRAGCTVFEGTKQRLTAFGRYLVVVTREEGNPATGSPTSSASNIQLSGIGGGGGGGVGPPVGGGFGLGGGVGFSSSGSGGGGSSCLQLADVRTKLLAGTFVLQGLQHVFCAWGAVHAVTAAGAVWCYREIDLPSQLETLLRRSLHKLALDVARSWTPGVADVTTLANIHQRWGDHLYGKGEYDAAMTQYLETVGHLEPSYVIRRFLDAQRIHNLTAYLELMHERGLATCDHTTLLLNCYTKLKVLGVRDMRMYAAAAAEAAAAATVASSSSRKAGGGGGGARKQQKQADAQAGTSSLASAAATGLLFDPDTAIRVLRGAGYAEHALWVADAAGQIDSVLDILLDELGDADEAIAFLEELSRKRRAEALKKYGKALIRMRAEAATGLIMDLCCALGLGPGAGASFPPNIKINITINIDIIIIININIVNLPSIPYLYHARPPPAPTGDMYRASVADFAHLYNGEPTALMLLCEFILNTNSGAAAAAAAAASHGHAHAVGGCGGNEEYDNVTARARAYERLLYHTLLELYLADQLWQQPNQQPQPLPVPTNKPAKTPTGSTSTAASSPVKGELSAACDNRTTEAF